MDANGPIINFEAFERENFNVDSYVKKIAAESIYASNLTEVKEKLNRNGQQTAEEIKQSVYKNYTNFMETAKEVGNLEGKMTQLRQSLDEQRKLLSLIKNLNISVASTGDQNTSSSSSKTSNQIQKSSLSLLLEQVEGCGLITQKHGRNLLYHSDLEALHIDDYSVSHKLHAYLLSDALLLTLPQRKRNRTNFNINSTSSLMSGPNRLVANIDPKNSVDSGSPANQYQYKFQAFYELQDIKIMNIEDSKEVRNSFQLLKFPESLAFRCANAHIKKEWLENIESAKKQLEIQLEKEGGNELTRLTSSLNNSTIREEDEEEISEKSSDEDHDRDDDSLDGHVEKSGKKSNKKYDLNNINLNNVSEHERNKILRELFSDFDILLAQRDFEKAVEMLLKIKQSTTLSSSSTSSTQPSNSTSLDAVQQLIYKQKETELINILRKDLIQSKERGNNKGVVKTGKRVVNILIKLKIYDEAIDLFIDYQKHLNAETLRKIKLEESNSIYMNNILNSFFENMRISYISFREAFSSLITFCFSSYSSWSETEIEILIKKLQSQHYLGRHFDLTIENCELIFVKAKQFSDTNFEVKFLFESKLVPILESSIKEEREILIDASLQRSKLEMEERTSNNEQARQQQIDKLLRDLESRELKSYFDEKDINLMKTCTSSCIQFSRGVINFFSDCLRVHYQDINFFIVEAVSLLMKAELKIYQLQLNSKSLNNNNNNNDGSGAKIKLKKQDIFNNIYFIEKVFNLIEKLYFEKTNVNSKFFVKLREKFNKTKEENLASNLNL
jgi:hypothetical protein